MNVYNEGEDSARSDYQDDHPSTRQFLNKLDKKSKAEALGQIAEVDEYESDGSYGDNQKYRLAKEQKSSRERRRRRKEREEVPNDYGQEDPYGAE